MGIVTMTMNSRMRRDTRWIHGKIGWRELVAVEIDLDEVFDSSAYTAHAAAIVARLDDVVG